MKHFFAFIPMLLIGCGIDGTVLPGRWQAVAFYEKGQSMPVPLDSVALIFSGDGQYEFRSAGFYRERGPFRISGTNLFLTDTTEKPAKEHVLNVLFLSADTLKIQMKKEDREQVLFLKKQS